MRRLVSCIFAVFLVLSFTACQKTEELPAGLLTHVFRKTEITLPEGFSYFNLAGVDGDTLVLSCRSYREEILNGEYKVFTTDYQYRYDTETGKGEFLETGQALWRYMTPCSDGMYMLEESGEDVISCTLLHAAADGTETRLPQLEKYAALGYHGFTHMTADADDNVFLTNGDFLMCIPADLSAPAVMEDVGYIFDLLKDGDGTVYAASEAENSITLTPVVFQNGKAVPAREQVLTVTAPGILQAAFTEGDTVCYRTEEGIFRWEPGMTAGEPVMDFENSGMQGEVYEMAVLSPEKIYLSYHSPTREDIVLALYEKAPDIDLSKVTTITLATTQSRRDLLNSRIADYHEANPMVRILTADYSIYNETADDTAGAERLMMDMEAGILQPDIWYGVPEDPVTGSYVTEGRFTDLYTLLAEEETYSADNLYGSVKSGYSYEGKLYGLPMAIEMKTVLTDRMYADGKTAWSGEDLWALQQTLPEGANLFPYGQKDMIYYFLQPAVLSSFVDRENGECHFDSSSFTGLLRCILTASAENVYYDTEERIEACRSGMLYAVPRAVISPRYDGHNFVYFGRDDTVSVGYPVYDPKTQSGKWMSGENPVFLIPDTADAELCWDFILTCLTDTDAADNMLIWKSEMDAYLREREGYSFFYSTNGSQRYSMSAANPIEADGPGEYIVWDEAYFAYLHDLLDSDVMPLPVGKLYTDIAAIVNEEFYACLADAISPEACAARIQSRAQICLSEQS